MVRVYSDIACGEIKIMFNGHYLEVKCVREKFYVSHIYPRWNDRRPPNWAFIEKGKKGNWLIPMTSIPNLKLPLNKIKNLFNDTKEFYIFLKQLREFVDFSTDSFNKKRKKFFYKVK
jgi:hypothetical protein